MTTASATGPRDGALTCRDLITVLSDYLETTLAPAARARVRVHLDGCEECRAYLATYQRTRGVAATGQRVEMPGEMKARLRMFLLSELSEPESETARQ